MGMFEFFCACLKNLAFIKIFCGKTLFCLFSLFWLGKWKCTKFNVLFANFFEKKCQKEDDLVSHANHFPNQQDFQPELGPKVALFVCAKQLSWASFSSIKNRPITASFSKFFFEKGDLTKWNFSLDNFVEKITLFFHSPHCQEFTVQFSLEIF